MEDGRHDGIATISPNDVLALRAILRFYEAYMMSQAMPSPERNRAIMTGHLLVFKLSYADAMVLTVEEVEHLKRALRVFIDQIKRQIPEERGRAGVLESSEQLLTYFDHIFGSLS